MDYSRGPSAPPQFSSFFADPLAAVTATSAQPAPSPSAATSGSSDGGSSSGSDSSGSDSNGPSGTSASHSTAAPASTGADLGASPGALTTFTTTNSAGSQVARTTQLSPSSPASSTAETAGTSSNPTTAAGTTNSMTTSGGISKGDLAAAIVVPIIIVALALLACLFLRRRRQQRSSNFDEEPGPSMAQKARGVFQGFVAQGFSKFKFADEVVNSWPDNGDRVTSEKPTVDGYGYGEVRGKVMAATARHPLENVRTNPRPVTRSSSGPSVYTSPNERHHGNGSSSSDPFSDAHAGSLSSSQRSVAWSGFSGPGAGLNAQSTRNNRSDSDETLRRPSTSRDPATMTGVIEDDAVSAISDVSTVSYHDAEVVVAHKASPSRASVIHLPGTSPPR